MLCWFKPNVCNKTLSYFWMRVCWRLQHDDIVLCAISSVWGRSASSCVLPFLTDEWLNPSQSISSFFFFFFCICASASSLSFLPGHPHQARLCEKTFSSVLLFCDHIPERSQMCGYVFPGFFFGDLKGIMRRNVKSGWLTDRWQLSSITQS